MIKLNDELEVKIEKLVYGGEGLARYEEEKFVIFVRNSLVGDELKVKITSITKKHAKAEIVEILKPSPKRVKPFCALYNACGSCDFQICDYEFSLEQKSLILKEIFQNNLE